MIENLLDQGDLARIQQAMRCDGLTARRAVEHYLARIERLNPALNAVRRVAPDALAQADARDREASRGECRGPLHGIPYMAKDNLLTADGLPATAGVAALRDFVPRGEATVVARLREAGAILLGKTNMTELADYVSDIMPAEFSAVGGVVKNPHGVAYGRGQGSSVGSACAVAAGLAPFAIGTETQNSIQAPAVHSSVVGLKPTVGLVSRHNIVPLVPSQDSPGVLARTVGDAALVFDAIRGPDARDGMSLAIGATRAAQRPLRLGVPRNVFANLEAFAAHAAPLAIVLQRLAAHGVELVDPCDVPTAEQVMRLQSSVFRVEFKASFDAFMQAHGAASGVGSLADLVAYNRAHPEAIPYGQSLLEAALASPDLRDPRYQADRRIDRALARDGLQAALSLYEVSALLVPMALAAKLSGKAGTPVLALPAGVDERGGPFGITLLGGFGDDLALLALGTSVARALPGRLATEDLSPTSSAP